MSRSVRLLAVLSILLGAIAAPPAHVRVGATAAPNVTGVSPTNGSASGGTAITLTGTDFTGATGVTIGGLPATDLVVVDDTTITAVTPIRVGPQRTVGATAIQVLRGEDGSNTDVTFGFRPALEEPNDEVVILGPLASRTQRNPVTSTSSAPYVVTGVDSATGQPYSFQTDVFYDHTDNSEPGWAREGDERATSRGYSTSVTDGASEVTLTSGGNCIAQNTFGGLTSYCSFFGPEVYSEAFYATTSQALGFTWRAQGGSDNYEVYAFLVAVDDDTTIPTPSTSNHTLVLHSRGGSTSNQTSAAAIPADGLYRFRFVNGSYDKTGGYALGANMFISREVVVGTANTITFPRLGDRVDANSTWSSFTVDLTSTSGAQVTVTAAGQCSVSSGFTAPTTTISVSSDGAGDCALTASQAAVGDFAPAASVTRSFTYRTSVDAPSAPTLATVVAGDASLTLTVLAPARDGGAPLLRYEYSSDGTNWTNATPAANGAPTTITVSSLTNGTAYPMRVRAVNSAGASAPSSIITATPGSPVNTGVPTVTGNAFVGETLTGDPGTWTSPDGSTITTALQWQANGVDIAGETGSTLVVTEAMIGKTLRVKVTATATFTATSATIEAVRNSVSTASVPDTRLTNLTILEAPGFAFDAAAATQSATVPTGTASVTLTPTASSSGATITVAGAAVSSGSAATPVPVAVGQTTISVVVSQGGSSSTYPVVITRTAPPSTAIVAPPLPPGPVLTAGAPPRPSQRPTARVDDVEVPIASTPAGTTRTEGATTVSTATILEVSTVSLAVDVTGAGEVRTNAGAAPEVRVVRDSVARTSGGGLLPGTEVRAWLPLDGTNARQLVTLPVAEDGTFTGELPFDGSTDRQSDGRPLPIGTHVLQLVGVDATGAITVIEQTVRIEQPAPSPEPDRTAGAPPALTPGASIATNAGVPEAVTVVPVPDARQARVEGSGWTMAVDIPSADGRVAPAEGGGALIELVEDDFAAVSGDGFLGGTRADVWLFSTPTLLGSVTIASDGTFSGEVDVTGIATGEHTLQLQGVGTDGYVRAANLGVVVVPRATEEPAAEPEPEPEPEPAPEAEEPGDRVEVVTAAGEDTGSSNLLLWIAIVVAAAGSGWWFLLGRRRRDEDEELAEGTRAG